MEEVTTYTFRSKDFLLTPRRQPGSWFLYLDSFFSIPDSFLIRIFAELFLTSDSL